MDEHSCNKNGEKVANVQEFTFTEKKLHQTVKKQKNSSAPGIDGVQNFWWKKCMECDIKMVQSMVRIT